MEVGDITLEVALKLLTLPRTVGEHPDSKEPVVAHNGRYGPYIKCGDETRSLPADISPIDVLLEQALFLLAQPKQRRGRGTPKEPLKVFEKESPITGHKVEVLDGRYGPYITDGATNASVPKAMDPQEVTFEKALDLLAERAAKGPSKKKRKKAAQKKTAQKKPTKKAAKKKAAKKKSAKKKSATKKKTAKSEVASEEPPF
jgi:DNA topoisomerase-1